MGKNINEIPEHLERVIIRPLVETFSYDYMYKNDFNNFLIKMVEYDAVSKAGVADVYFSSDSTKYTHLSLRVPIDNKMENNKAKIVVSDIIVVKIDFDTPRKKK